MNKNCRKISERMLSGEPPTPEMLAHRRECAECDALLRTWETVQNTPARLMDVPENLDRFICTAAKHHLEHAPADSRRKTFLLWLGSAAAVFAVTFFSMFLLPDSGEPAVRAIAGKTAGPETENRTVAASDWDFTDLNSGLAAMSGELETDSAAFGLAQNNSPATQLEFDYAVYSQSKKSY